MISQDLGVLVPGVYGEQWPSAGPTPVGDGLANPCGKEVVAKSIE